MMKQPFFSVLISVYNHQDYIKETLESVVSQKYNDFEVLIVNDGSTDKSEEMIIHFLNELDQSTRSKFVYIETENKGQATALETAFYYSKGKYISLLDSDDRWLTNKLETVHEVIEYNPGYDLYSHLLFVIDESGKRTGDIRPKGAKLSHGDIQKQVASTTRHVFPATSGLVFSRQVFGSLLPMPLQGISGAADAYLTLGGSLFGKVFAIESPLGEYRLHLSGQYIKRMLTAEGLQKQLKIQTRITDAFYISGKAWKNSYFSRNLYAHNRLLGKRSFFLLARLIISILIDTAFSRRQKALFILFWSTSYFVNSRLFKYMWMYFQAKQTGISLFSKNELDVSGYKVSTKNLFENMDEIVYRAENGIGGKILTLNLEMIARSKNIEYAKLTKDSDLVVADGMPIVWLSKLFPQTEIRGRSTGTDLVQLIFDNYEGKFAIIGGPDKEVLYRKLGIDKNRAIIFSGFIDTNDKSILSIGNDIEKFGAKIVMIALGVPKQDAVAKIIRGNFPHMVTIGIGGALDLLSGEKPRAPKFLQNAGFEWLFRLVVEPKRLWRRYLLEYPKAIGIVEETIRDQYSRAEKITNK